MSDGLSDNPGYCDCGPCMEVCDICKKLRWTKSVIIDDKCKEVCEECEKEMMARLSAAILAAAPTTPPGTTPLAIGEEVTFQIPDLRGVTIVAPERVERPAYNGCKCGCHAPGSMIVHCFPCCRPSPPPEKKDTVCPTCGPGPVLYSCPLVCGVCKQEIPGTGINVIDLPPGTDYDPTKYTMPPPTAADLGGFTADQIKDMTA